MMESTPQALVDLIVLCGKTIDSRYRGLRESDGEEWASKVAALGHSIDTRFGRKSAHGVNGKKSIDTFAIRLEEGGSGKTPFYGVSIIRDNPPINEWRATPHDYGMIDSQFWILPEKVEFGGPIEDSGEEEENSEGEEPAKEQEMTKGEIAIIAQLQELNNKMGMFLNDFQDARGRISQVKDAVKELNETLKNKSFKIW